MDVVNLSIGGPGAPSPQEQLLFNRLLAGGTTVVAAMGNDAQRGNPIEYPAAIPGVIAVGATNVDDSIADFSSFGGHIALCAPGVAIWSTLPTYPGQSRFFPALGPGGTIVQGTPDQRETDYDAWQGTSMAAPHVTASVALLLARRGATDPVMVKQLLQAASDQVPGMNGAAFDVHYGAGRLNLNRLL
jgi:subtilisin family serine protease